MSQNITRRELLKWGMMSGAGFIIGERVFRGKALAALPPETGCGIQEVMPVSPFIVRPFRDKLPVPKAMAPGWRPDPTDPGKPNWYVRKARFLGPDSPAGVVTPGPAEHKQDVYGHRLAGEVLDDGQVLAVEHAGTHQVWPTPAGQNFNRLENWPAQGVAPIRYHIRYQLAEHSFTSSRVRPVDSQGNPVIPPPGAPVTLDANGTAALPASTIFGFNGTFPGPMINTEYGKPVVVRFENDLDKNPQNLDLGDFGAPDRAVLTHLHNGHTAPESDGQPHYMQINEGGYVPGDWYDNMYLNYPAGGDPNEIQSFLWFHDHRMHHTGANVYKGMVGLFPMYDPGIPAAGGGIVPGTGLDTGNESDPAPNLKLPGVRVNRPGRRFDVKYDIPMAFYDCALDDGVTPHADLHVDNAVCGASHPEWWGKTFFRHFPNHGFVGDIFTVNGKAYPVLNVKRRKYRLRFLGASVARIYELCLMKSAAGPQPRPGTQGQWQIPDGVLATPLTQIASMGGLLPTPIVRDAAQIWPATRNEHVIDFSQFQQGDVIYLTNVLEMKDGRLPDFKPNVPVNDRQYKVPLVKIVIGGLPVEPDQSVMPVPGQVLRPMPVLPNQAALDALPHASFILKRTGAFGDESQWVINDLPFDPLVPLHTVKRGQPEVWTNINGGGGWVHPMHMHMEEHTVLERVNPTSPHPDDTGKSDVTNLDPGEQVTFYRNFRTFTGRYVAHCHNLAHEDHNMMFGWEIVEP
jgi:FtsP/CotA-like multicopper oxidase with cupredoxin domain